MMVWIAGALALLCLAYYIVIALYSGITTSFAFIWLIASGFFFLVAAGVRYAHLHPKKLPLWMPVSAATVFFAGLAIFCTVEILVFMGAASSDVPNLDYLIVLGAPVKEESISDSLKKRLDKAIAYSQKNPDTMLVLSGGKEGWEEHYEAQVMYDYLVYNGVPAKNLLMETVSTSTVENIAYSRVLIEQMQEEKRLKNEAGRNRFPQVSHAQAEPKPVQIGVLTSSYHVYRAKKIAQKWGIPGIHGIASESDPILFVHLCVRECAAILKDRLMGNM